LTEERHSTYAIGRPDREIKPLPPHDHPQNPRVRLLDGAFYAGDPQSEFAWLRDQAPVYWDETARVWGVSRHADVLAISRDPETFRNAGGIRADAPPMAYLIDLDDPEHRKRRSLVNKGFTARRVAEREPRIREISVGLIERARARGRFDFVTDVAAWLPLIVIGDMLGVAPEDHGRLLQWSDDMVLGAGATTPERIDRAQRAFVEYADYQRRVVADRRRRPPQDDLVSVLVHAEIDGERLTDDELLMESLLILIGGDETTRHVISAGMYQLLRHPAARRRLIEEPAGIPTAVEEMLRWATPIQNMARTAARDVELHGQRVRAGEKVLLLYPSANRDPRVFADPGVFDVTRSPNDHLAFGFGAHFCLGASLARLELRVLFEEVLRRMPDLALASDAPPPVRVSNFISGLEMLPVALPGA
jgi:cytochrome P450 family 142 subfamily A polypeptide 1